MLSILAAVLCAVTITGAAADQGELSLWLWGNETISAPATVVQLPAFGMLFTTVTYTAASGTVTNFAVGINAATGHTLWETAFPSDLQQTSVVTLQALSGANDPTVHDAVLLLVFPFTYWTVNATSGVSLNKTQLPASISTVGTFAPPSTVSVPYLTQPIVTAPLTTPPTTPVVWGFAYNSLASGGYITPFAFLQGQFQAPILACDGAAVQQLMALSSNKVLILCATAIMQLDFTTGNTDWSLPLTDPNLQVGVQAAAVNCNAAPFPLLLQYTNGTNTLQLVQVSGGNATLSAPVAGINPAALAPPSQAMCSTVNQSVVVIATSTVIYAYQIAPGTTNAAEVWFYEADEEEYEALSFPLFLPYNDLLFYTIFNGGENTLLGLIVEASTGNVAYRWEPRGDYEDQPYYFQFCGSPGDGKIFGGFSGEDSTSNGDVFWTTATPSGDMFTPSFETNNLRPASIVCGSNYYSSLLHSTLYTVPVIVVDEFATVRLNTDAVPWGAFGDVYSIVATGTGADGATLTLSTAYLTAFARDGTPIWQTSGMTYTSFSHKVVRFSTFAVDGDFTHTHGQDGTLTFYDSLTGNPVRRLFNIIPSFCINPQDGGVDGSSNPILLRAAMPDASMLVGVLGQCVFTADAAMNVVIVAIPGTGVANPTVTAQMNLDKTAVYITSQSNTVTKFNVSSKTIVYQAQPPLTAAAVSLSLAITNGQMCILWATEIPTANTIQCYEDSTGTILWEQRFQGTDPFTTYATAIAAWGDYIILANSYLTVAVYRTVFNTTTSRFQPEVVRTFSARDTNSVWWMWPMDQMPPPTFAIAGDSIIAAFSPCPDCISAYNLTTGAFISELRTAQWYAYNANAASSAQYSPFIMSLDRRIIYTVLGTRLFLFDANRPRFLAIVGIDAEDTDDTHDFTIGGGVISFTNDIGYFAGLYLPDSAVGEAYSAFNAPATAQPLTLPPGYTPAPTTQPPLPTPAAGGPIVSPLVWSAAMSGVVASTVLNDGYSLCAAVQDSAVVLNATTGTVLASRTLCTFAGSQGVSIVQALGDVCLMCCRSALHGDDCRVLDRNLNLKWTVDLTNAIGYPLVYAALRFTNNGQSALVVQTRHTVHSFNMTSGTQIFTVNVGTVYPQAVLSALSASILSIFDQDNGAAAYDAFTGAVAYSSLPAITPFLKEHYAAITTDGSSGNLYIQLARSKWAGDCVCAFNITGGLVWNVSTAWMEDVSSSALRYDVNRPAVVIGNDYDNYVVSFNPTNGALLYNTNFNVSDEEDLEKVVFSTPATSAQAGLPLFVLALVSSGSGSANQRRIDARWASNFSAAWTVPYGVVIGTGYSSSISCQTLSATQVTITVQGQVYNLALPTTAGGSATVLWSAPTSNVKTSGGSTVSIMNAAAAPLCIIPVNDGTMPLACISAKSVSGGSTIVSATGAGATIFATVPGAVITVTDRTVQRIVSLTGALAWETLLSVSLTPTGATNSPSGYLATSVAFDVIAILGAESVQFAGLTNGTSLGSLGFVGLNARCAPFSSNPRTTLFAIAPSGALFMNLADCLYRVDPAQVVRNAANPAATVQSLRMNVPSTAFQPTFEVMPGRTPTVLVFSLTTGVGFGVFDANLTIAFSADLRLGSALQAGAVVSGPFLAGRTATGLVSAVYAATSQLLWRIALSEAPDQQSQPLAYDAALFVATSRHLYRLSMNDTASPTASRIVWNATVPPPSALCAPTAMAPRPKAIGTAYGTVIASYGCQVVAFVAATGAQTVWPAPLNAPAPCTSFAVDGDWVAATCGDVLVFNVVTGMVILQAPYPTGAAIFVPSGLMGAPSAVAVPQAGSVIVLYPLTLPAATSPPSSAVPTANPAVTLPPGYTSPSSVQPAFGPTPPPLSSGLPLLSLAVNLTSGEPGYWNVIAADPTSFTIFVSSNEEVDAINTLTGQQIWGQYQEDSVCQPWDTSDPFYGFVFTDAATGVRTLAVVCGDGVDTYNAGNGTLLWSKQTNDSAPVSYSYDPSSAVYAEHLNAVCAFAVAGDVSFKNIAVECLTKEQRYVFAPPTDANSCAQSEVTSFSVAPKSGINPVYIGIGFQCGSMVSTQNVPMSGIAVIDTQTNATVVTYQQLRDTRAAAYVAAWSADGRYGVVVSHNQANPNALDVTVVDVSNASAQVHTAINTTIQVNNNPYSIAAFVASNGLVSAVFCGTASATFVQFNGAAAPTIQWTYTYPAPNSAVAPVIPYNQTSVTPERIYIGYPANEGAAGFLSALTLATGTAVWTETAISNTWGNGFATVIDSPAANCLVLLDDAGTAAIINRQNASALGGFQACVPANANGYCFYPFLYQQGGAWWAAAPASVDGASFASFQIATTAPAVLMRPSRRL
jgi:hypothetical protein